MSDRVHRKQRPALPEGYQFGDARRRAFEKMPLEFIGATNTVDSALLILKLHAESWRAPHENSAAQLKRQQCAGEETV